MRVVIIGGGFGGLSAARALKDVPVDLTLIDQNNYHLFQPLLYQVATGGLSPANIAAPLRSILHKQKNARVLLGEVVGFDVSGHRVLLRDGEVDYDVLIVATGARHHYFGHQEWEPDAPGLKSLDDALEIRRRLFFAFEAAERETNPEAVEPWLTFVVVGGGPTGVELAGAIAEVANHTLSQDYRSIQSSDARVYLVEATDRILPTFAPELSAAAQASLEKLHVRVMTSTSVSNIQPNGVTVIHDGEKQHIASHTVLWAAGNQVLPIATALRDATSATADRAGRLNAQPDLTLPGYPDVFVIGDLAHFEQDGSPLPAVAPVAIQQGRYVARAIASRLDGRETKDFRYHSQGLLATIGRSAAVADFGRLKLSGLPAWLVWLFVHLMQLAQFENRLLVLTQWAWNYVTRSRSARLITNLGRPSDSAVAPTNDSR